MENLNWDEIKENLRKSVKLDKKMEDLSIKITIKKSNIEENQFIGKMLKNEDEMKQSLSAFINEGKPIDCDVEVNQKERYILLKFREKRIWIKTFELFNDLFFGDYLKKMIEAMMGAFGGMFSK
jgi:hypothetical protein